MWCPHNSFSDCGPTLLKSYVPCIYRWINKTKWNSGWAGVADEAASTTSLQFLAHCAINFASILSDDMSVAPKQDIFSKSINAKLQATSYKSHYSYEGWWGVFTCSIYHSYSWMQSLMSLMKTLTLHPTRIKADILNEGNLEGNIVVIYWGFGGKYDCSLW